MKKILLSLTISLFAFSSFAQYQRDTAYMQTSQTNDVYYSLLNGEVNNNARNAWDIEFYTFKFSAGIRINSYDGVELYTYPNGDTSNWNTLDTAGISNWTQMLNSTDEWEMGAFSQNELGHPDYGWGIYNMQSHEIHGDSLFVIKTTAGNYLKLRLIYKDAVPNLYYFKYENLDGTNAQNITLDCSQYDNKLLVAYNLSTNSVYDHHPLKADWDLKFTNYVAAIPGFGGYPLQGVLANENVQVAMYNPGDTASTYWNIGDLDSTTISGIGYSFKSMGVIKDSMVYVVSDVAGNMWKLIFEYYNSTEGKIGFRKQMLSATSIETSLNSKLVVSELFPNPSQDMISFALNSDKSTSILVNIIDINGKIVQERTINANGLQTYSFDIRALKQGIYFISLKGENINQNLKFIKQ